MENLKELFRQLIHTEPAAVVKIDGSGSNRCYYKMLSEDGRTIIGTVGNDVDENKAFLSIGKHLREKGLPVPEVYSVSDDKMTYLQEFISDDSLYMRLTKARTSGDYQPEDIALLDKVMRLLGDIQVLGAQGLDWSSCYPEETFTSRAVISDLNYFRYYFLKPSGIEFNENRLMDELEVFRDDLLAMFDLSGFMYRDFQARNVMIRDEEPWFIDFQGGRRGPLLYDLVSFVWQARATYPEELREHLIDVYFEHLSELMTFDETKARRDIASFRLFRALQVLGAYGFRGRVERKTHFLMSIPAALVNLEELLDCEDIPWGRYGYFREVLRELIAAERASHLPDFDGLTVTVMSFSYTRGIPYDAQNGGGYVFDCRYVHNPGRYEEYKHSTGMDDDVIQFLDTQSEMPKFMENVYAFTDPHIEVFLRRHFTNLMVCFGCTGGQHRSVYGAEHLAAHIRSKYPGVRVHLVHREQGVDEIIS